MHIIGLIFYDTIDTARYMEIFDTFYTQLTENEKEMCHIPNIQADYERNKQSVTWQACQQKSVASVITGFNKLQFLFMGNSGKQSLCKQPVDNRGTLREHY